MSKAFIDKETPFRECWQAWIETVELQAGRNLRKNDFDLDAAMNAFLAGDNPVDYARAVMYPHAVSTVLLWYTLAALIVTACAAVLVAWSARGAQ